MDFPDLPRRMKLLPRDSRGFPVPWFVQWFKDGEATFSGDGEPDFRVIDSRHFEMAMKGGHCWICGTSMGVHRVFVIGPMCVVNRVTSEPPSHRDCAEFAARNCPFLSKPRMRRNAKDFPIETMERAAPGIMIDRNPGVCCLYETLNAKPFKPQIGAPGILFKLGDPTRVDWYANGRAATRMEVLDSISTGYPILEKMAQQDGRRAVEELSQQAEVAMKYLPPEQPA